MPKKIAERQRRVLNSHSSKHIYFILDRIRLPLQNEARLIPYFTWARSELAPCLVWMNAWNVRCNLRQTTTPGTTRPTLFDKCVGSLTSPANHVTLKMQETGRTVYRPYPGGVKCLTICRYNYKGSTVSSVILRPRVLVRYGARTFDLPRSRLALYQLS